MAGRPMGGLELPPLGIGRPAMVLHDRAARVKPAAAWQINWGWRLTLQDDPLPVQPWVGHRDHREQRLGVGMLGVLEQ